MAVVSPVSGGADGDDPGVVVWLELGRVFRERVRRREEVVMRRDEEEPPPPPR